jgi:hypothetical protein
MTHSSDQKKKTTQSRRLACPPDGEHTLDDVGSPVTLAPHGNLFADLCSFFPFKGDTAMDQITSPKSRQSFKANKRKASNIYGVELVIDDTTVFSTMKFVECEAPDNDNDLNSRDEGPVK